MVRRRWQAVAGLVLWWFIGAGACTNNSPTDRAGRDAAAADRSVADAPAIDAPAIDAPTADAATADAARDASTAGCVTDQDCGQLKRCQNGRCVACFATCTSNADCVIGAVCVVGRNSCSSCEVAQASVH